MSKHLLALDQLDEIIDVLKKSGFSNTKWYSLGLRLGLVKNTLDGIDAQYRGDFDRCLMECLSCWLNKADNVVNKGGPNWISLTSSLRSMNQVAVADNIDQKKQPAYFILYQHHAALSQDLKDPVYVARSLQTENLIPEEIVTSIERKLFLSEQKKALLTSVQDAVLTNYRNLLIFSNALMSVTGNELLAKSISNNYKKVFTDDMEHNNTEDTQVTTAATDTPTPGKKIYVPRSISSEFTAMRTKFGRTFLRVLDIIEKHRISVEQLKRFIRFTYSDLVSKLTITNTMDDIRSLLQEKCSLLNISLLEDIVEEFELKEAKIHIKGYKAEINDFCQTMSVRLCLNETFQVSAPHPPLKYESITFVVEGNPDNYMLDDVRNLLSSTFEILSRSLHLVVIKEDNSITISCTFPIYLGSQLIARAFKKLQMLRKRFGLLSLVVGYATIWNGQNRDEELIELRKQLTTLPEQLKIEKKQSLLEKQTEIQRLKQMLSVKEDNIKSLTDTSESLAMHKKVNKEMSLEVERLKLVLKSKKVVGKQEIEVLKFRERLLSRELLKYKEKNSKLINDNDYLQSKVKGHSQLEDTYYIY